MADNVDYMIREFTRASLEDMFDNKKEGDVLQVYSPSEISLFLKDASPLTVMDINDATGMNFSVNKYNLQKQAIALAANLINTIDNSIFNDRMRIDMVGSKVRNLKNIYRCLGEECPISENDLTEDNMLSFAHDVKISALDVCRRYQKKFDQYKTLKAKGKHEFISFFEGLFGENLRGIIQFGSSVSGGGKDIDLMVLVNEYDRQIYDQIQGRAEDVPSEKPVGILMIPYDLFPAYASCEASTRMIGMGKEGRLIYGKPFNFPIMSEKDAIARMYIKEAGKNFTSLRGALGDEKRLNNMVNSPHFAEFTLKSEIWIRKAIKQMELGRMLSKDEFLELEPVDVQKFDRPSLDEIKNALLDANYRVHERVCNIKM